MPISTDYLEQENIFYVSIEDACPPEEFGANLKKIEAHPSFTNFQGILWDFEKAKTSGGSDKVLWELILISRETPILPTYKKSAYLGCTKEAETAIREIYEFIPGIEIAFFDDKAEALAWITAP